MSEHTTEDTINRLKSLTEKLSLVQDRITIEHAVIEIQTAIAEAVELRAERDEARLQTGRILNEIDCRIEHGAESNGHLEAIHNLFKEDSDER